MFGGPTLAAVLANRQGFVMGLAKLVQLFAEGKELVLSPPGGEPVVIWVAKLSAFQEEQANQSGRVARARRMLAIREIGTPEYDLFRGGMLAAPREEILNSIVGAKSNDLFLKSMRDVRSDPAWREKIELIEFSDRSADDAEAQLMLKLDADYNTELLRRHDEELDILRRDLALQSRGELEEVFLDTYLEEQGYHAFSAEKGRWQMYYAMRTCVAAPPKEEERWDHDRCKHRELFLDAVEDVDQLPSTVTDQVLATYSNLVVPPSVSRFTGARPNSSESPELSTKAEDSKDSGPEGTSTAPATT